MVEQVDILLADAIEVELALLGQRRSLYPLPFLPVAAIRGNLANVDLGVEVGGKGVAMIAAVGIENIDAVNFVEQVLLRVGAVNIGHAGVEAAAQGGHVDRKSTRLNSSHVAISYAVFCLKKKTNQYDHLLCNQGSEI